MLWGHNVQGKWEKLDCCLYHPFTFYSLYHTNQHILNSFVMNLNNAKRSSIIMQIVLPNVLCDFCLSSSWNLKIMKSLYWQSCTAFSFKWGERCQVTLFLSWLFWLNYKSCFLDIKLPNIPVLIVHISLYKTETFFYSQHTIAWISHRTHWL